MNKQTARKGVACYAPAIAAALPLPAPEAARNLPAAAALPPARPLPAPAAMRCLPAASPRRNTASTTKPSSSAMSVVRSCTNTLKSTASSGWLRI
ncbi:MAG: hypothetical protein LBH25_02220 [Fibromonadaceae bacterium]|nr:hypothetical protein [Fibromonadaceae bacterium]